MSFTTPAPGTGEILCCSHPKKLHGLAAEIQGGRKCRLGTVSFWGSHLGSPAEDVQVQKIQSRLWAEQRGHTSPEGWKGCSFTALPWAVHGSLSLEKAHLKTK